MPTNIYTIYKHTSPSGKSYIGVTKNGIQHRLREHIRSAEKGSKYAFHKAIRKHGIENFVTEELFYTNDKEFAYEEMEVYFVNLYGTTNSSMGYNMTPGGQAGPSTAGRTLPPEHCKKISDAKKGSKNHFFGKSHSEEAKRKMSEKRKGVSLPQKQVTCPHCNLTGGICNMVRYHFDNCNKK